MEVLVYLNERYKEEQERFNHFEKKCSTLLTFLTGLLGGLGIFGNYIKNALFNATTPLEWIQTILFCIALFCIACAWGHSLLALKIGDTPIMPKSQEAANYINQANEDNRNRYIYQCYVDTLSELSSVIDTKALNLQYAYEELTYSAWSLSLLGSIILFKEIFK